MEDRIFYEAKALKDKQLIVTKQLEKLKALQTDPKAADIVEIKIYADSCALTQNLDVRLDMENDKDLIIYLLDKAIIAKQKQLVDLGAEFKEL